MKQLFCIILTLFLVACSQRKEQFQIEVLNSYTPVKQQGKSASCWIYAMLSAIETEHIMRGDSVELSTAWIETMMRRDPHAPRNGRGTALTVLHLINRYGIVPHHAMPNRNASLPRWAFMLGTTYTPHEFAHSVCAPGEYIGIGATDGQPSYTYYKLNNPDNWTGDSLWNVPRDSLLALTERAVRNRHGVCWEGDISENGFDWKHGVARPSLIGGSTTDDHCMAIVGIARDQEGQPYFVMKNSWGTENQRKGLIFMHFDYFLRNTVLVVLPKETTQCLQNRPN